MRFRIGLFCFLGVLISTIVGVVGELQRELNRERGTLATTLRSIADGVITTDKNGQITFLNDVAQQATGWPLADTLGRSIEEIVPLARLDTRLPVLNPARQVLGTGAAAVLASDTLLVRRDGTDILISGSAAPIRDDGTKIDGVVLVFRDITKAGAAERALHQSERLTSVGRLASTMAHEINNPLEAVTNLIYLALKATAQRDVRNYLQIADEELNRR